MFRLAIGAQAHLSILTHQDTEAVFALTNGSREYLRQWLPWLDAVQSAEATQAFIANGLEQLARNNGFQAGIWHGRQLMGCIGLHGIDWANRYTALGYWLGQPFQGRGLMTQATRGVIDLVFSHYGLNRIEIRAAVGNAKSRAIPERLGFRQEGIIRDAEWLYDHYVDHAVYGLLRADWQPASNSED